MIKNALKNVFKNSIFIFVAMGIVYLVILLALFWLISAFTGNIGDTFNKLGALINDSSVQSSTAVTEFLGYAFGQINWHGNFFATIRQIISTEWIQNTVKGFFETLDVSAEGFGEQFTLIIDGFFETFISQIVAFAAVCAIGIMLANLATRFAIRRRSARRNIKRTIFAFTITPILQSAMIIIIFVTAILIGYFAILAFVAIVIAAEMLSLIFSWLVYKDESLKLKDVFTLKNILQNLAVRGILYASCALLAVLLWLINPLIAILLTIPVIIYIENIIEINTDSFVSETVKSSKPNLSTENLDGTTKKQIEENTENLGETTETQIEKATENFNEPAETKIEEAAENLNENSEGTAE